MTAMKDEGAANSFISLGLVKQLQWEDAVQQLPDTETKHFSGMGGSDIPLKGKLTHIKC